MPRPTRPAGHRRLARVGTSQTNTTITADSSRHTSGSWSASAGGRGVQQPAERCRQLGTTWSGRQAAGTPPADRLGREAQADVEQALNTQSRRLSSASVGCATADITRRPRWTPATAAGGGAPCRLLGPVPSTRESWAGRVARLPVHRSPRTATPRARRTLHHHGVTGQRDRASSRSVVTIAGRESVVLHRGARSELIQRRLRVTAVVTDPRSRGGTRRGYHVLNAFDGRGRPLGQPAGVPAARTGSATRLLCGAWG
jgi:hypothetical protein